MNHEQLPRTIATELLSAATEIIERLSFVTSRGGFIHSCCWALAGTLTIGTILASSHVAVAQIIPDTTLGTQNSTVTRDVLIRGIESDRIDGGAIRGANLFHSFEQFNIDAVRGAYFTNPAGIQNILSRVTGSNPSNILGRLGVLGNANLFLINPNGILFGENASLDVSGSFVATTANAIQFGAQGFFSANNPEAPSSLLTVNPSAFLFNQIPTGNIVNNSVAPIAPSSDFLVGLRVANRENLTLLGGSVNIDGGQLSAFGGRVEIGAVAGTGTVGLNADGSLNFPTNVQRADVSFTNGAGVDVSLNNGGDIAITARNIDISGGSLLLAGIDSRFGSVDSQAGDIALNATGEIRVVGSGIFNQVSPNVTGNGGNIELATGSLSITNGAELQASTFGRGDAGSVIINARDRVLIDGTSANGQFLSGAFSRVQQSAVGNGGNVELTTGSLSVTNRGQLSALTLGKGNAGNVIINARDQVSFDNSTAISRVEEGAVGRGGNIKITTGSLTLTNGGQLDTSPFGQGDGGNIIINARDAVSLDGISRDRERYSTFFTEVVEDAKGNGGNIEIFTDSLFVTNGAKLDAGTSGQGNSGSISINARDRVEFAGDETTAFSNVETGAVGNAGTIAITTGSLSLLDGAQLSTIVREASGSQPAGRGNAGNVIINTRNDINISGVSRVSGKPSGIRSLTAPGVMGNGGNIDINSDTGSLLVTNGAQLDTETLGQGKAGSIIINARDRVEFDNGFAASRVEEGAKGNGGDISITTGSLSLTNNANLNTSTSGQGKAGNVLINASAQISLDSDAYIASAVDKMGNGNGGDILITTGSLSLTNNANLNTSTSGQGKAGNILINASAQISLDSDAYIASAVDKMGNGNGGDILITTGSLSIAGAAQLDTSTFGQGSAGDVIIEARDTVTSTGISPDGIPSGVLSTVEETGIGNGGKIRISTGSLFLTDSARLNASTAGRGDAGDIVIEARDIVSLAGTSSDGAFPSIALSAVGETGNGDGGNIHISARSLSLTDDAQLSTSTRGQGIAGNVIIEASNQVSLNDAVISSNIGETGNGAGGNIRISTGTLSVTNGAELQASTFGQGNAGDVNIEARDSVDFRGTDRNGRPSIILTRVEESGDGDGGDIRITTGVLSATDGAQLSSTTYGQGSAGDIIINARDRISLDYAGIFSTVGFPDLGIGNGDAGDIHITTGSLSLTNGAQLSSSTFARGDASDIIIEARDSVSFAGVGGDNNLPSAAFSAVGLTGNGDGGNIRIATQSLSITDGARLYASTEGQGNAGNIQIDARDTVLLNGMNSRTELASELSSSTFEEAGGSGGTITVNTDSFRIADGAVVGAQTLSAFRGGDVSINARNLSLTDRAQISASSSGTGSAGGVAIAANEALTLTNSDITTAAEQASGGAISISAGAIRLYGDSDIRTNVESGSNNGGNITLLANSILAFDDSDILAFAQDGRGGNVTLSTPAFLGENYQPAAFGINPNTLDGNQRVDINASGAVNGAITLPDNSFIQNSLLELPEKTVDAERLIANSCIARTQQRSSFVITGTGGLPKRPGDASISPYPTGEVRSVTSDNSSSSGGDRPWQVGEPIIEPQGVYQLPDGQLVLSRECSE